jgi:hypothetical protein
VAAAGLKISPIAELGTEERGFESPPGSA